MRNSGRTFFKGEQWTKTLLGVSPEPCLHMWWTEFCLPALLFSNSSHGLSIFQTELWKTQILDHFIFLKRQLLYSGRDTWMTLFPCMPSTSEVSCHSYNSLSKVYMWDVTSDLCPPGTCPRTHQKFLDPQGRWPSGGSSKKTPRCPLGSSWHRSPTSNKVQRYVRTF